MTNKLALIAAMVVSVPFVDAQIDSGASHSTSNHNKQIIGYVPQYDAWKATSSGYSQQGVLNQLNLDYTQYTHLNFSFFGVAYDGTLHSADLRNKQIYEQGTRQEPGQLLMTDTSSSWDYWILFGELDPQWTLSQAALDAGYEADGSGWKHTGQGISGAAFPIPLPKAGGEKGLIELCHESGVKCMASIGGWSMCKHFAEVAADTTKRAKFVADCKRLTDLGFDGIDIDWEFPGPFAGMNFTGTEADFANFTTLIGEIRQAIGPNRLITAAFHSGAVKLNGFEWKKLVTTMDYFNIMAYDYHGGWSNIAGHNSPLFSYTGEEGGASSWNDTVKALASHGVPLEKVTMGLAFYGRSLVTSGEGAVNAPTVKSEHTIQPDGPVSTCSDLTTWPAFGGVPYYTRIKNNLSGWTQNWDNEAKVPYLTKSGGFLSYDNPRSVGLKAKYVRDNGLGGVIVWTAFGDIEPGSIDGGTTKLPKSSTTKSPLINVVNSVLAGGNVPDELLSNAFISVASTNVTEGNSGSTDLEFKIALSAPSDGSVSVDYATSDGTAIAGNDYTSTSGSVTFAHGETVKTISVPVTPETTQESNETMTLTLSDATGASLATTTATGTITDDDTAPGTPSLSITGADIAEGDSGSKDATLTVSVSPAPTGNVTVDWATSDGTATAGDDYTAASGSLSFASGETSKTITVAINGDTNVEPDETVTLTLSNASGASIGAASTLLTIINDDATSQGNGPAFGLSKLATDRPIVMGYVNALRSATGHEQSLTAAQLKTEIQSIHWAGYDVLVHSFAEPLDSVGSIGESLGNFTAYQSDLLTEAHARNKSVILSIGGAYPARLQNQFLAIAQDATKRANFVSEVVNYLKAKGYDGVDIDWEFPQDAAGKDALTQLMQDLYAAVKAEHSDYMVMFGTGPGYYMGSYDFAVLKDHTDFFFYFGYDWKGASPSGANGPMKQPGSGVQWTTAGDTLYEKSVRGGIQYVLDKGFPADKIICGLPFYGSNNISWAAVRDTWAADMATYDAAIDPDAMEVKINNVWYTTPKAMKMKMDALLKTGSSVLNNSATIRGVGTWEIGHEHKSNPDLSKAFEEWMADYAGNPVLPSISVADASIVEGDSGTGTLTMTVTMNRTSDTAVTVDYTTGDGTATSGSDYNAASGTLTFAAGETSKTVNVTILGDTADETDETFTLTLSNVSISATISDATATGTITDDDTAASIPSLSITGADIAEGDTGSKDATLSVSVSPAPTGNVTVDWATSDGTATAGEDYTAASGSLSFASGETSKTITVAINGDTNVEPDETVTLTLSNASGASIGTASALLTITNDDTTTSDGQPGWTRHFTPSDGFTVSYTTPSGGEVWSTGFSGKIEIVNNGNTLDSWTLTFDAPWSTTGSGNAGSWDITNNHHTVSNPSWAGYSVENGGTISLDFTGSGVWQEPTNLRLNGNSPSDGADGNTKFADWKAAHNINDVSGDTNGNSLPDIIDFLIGNDLSAAAGGVVQPLAAAIRPLTVAGDNADYFCVELDADTKAEGVEYRIEVSSDLNTWIAGSNVMLVHETSINADGSTHAIWRSAQPLDEADAKMFARLIAREISTDGSDTGDGTDGGTGGGTDDGTGGGIDGPAGAPNAPTTSVQKDWEDGVGHKITWNTWGGHAATEWKLYQNGVLIHTGALTGDAPQTATYDFNESTIGAFVYTIELTNSVGTATSAPVTFLTDFASPMNLAGIDSASQASQITVDSGQSTLTIQGGVSPYTVSVNHPAALSASVSGDTVTLNATPGMRSGLKIIDANGDVRLVGVRVKNTDGTNPGLPDYLSIGSVSEDSQADLDFFADYQTEARKNKWVDYRYIYINGGVKRKGVGWRTWTAPKDGDRMRKFVRESIKRGMLPVIVWYNIPDGGESYTTDLEHMQEEDYMQGYFEDLKFAIDIANEEAGDEMVLWVLEPDFIGYMAQNNENPATLMAQTNAAYDVGVLDSSNGDPLFPDTMRGLIEAINYTLKKHSNNAYIGWQFNLWAFPAGGWVQGSQVGVKGLMRVSDDRGMTDGRAIVRAEGLAVADYYMSCGILTHGADFVSIDKYGLDGGAEQKNDDPAASTWFWNAEHWGNYLHYCKALNDRTGKQVMLWQLPVGHINSSLLISPYTGSVFPDHPNVPRDWEDSAPTFFFGDTFKPGAGNRYDWFKLNRDNYTNVTLDADGETITWGSHMTMARDAGIHIMLFGDGVGNSTRGRGDSNTDEFWWITAAQDYYANPVPLTPVP